MASPYDDANETYDGDGTQTYDGDTVVPAFRYLHNLVRLIETVLGAHGGDS